MVSLFRKPKAKSNLELMQIYWEMAGLSEGRHECEAIQRMSEQWRSLDDNDKALPIPEVVTRRGTNSTGPK